MFTAAVRVRTPTERQELLVKVMQKGLAFDWLVVDGHCYLYLLPVSERVLFINIILPVPPFQQFMIVFLAGCEIYSTAKHLKPSL